MRECNWSFRICICLEISIDSEFRTCFLFAKNHLKILALAVIFCERRDRQLEVSKWPAIILRQFPVFVSSVYTLSFSDGFTSQSIIKYFLFFWFQYWNRITKWLKGKTAVRIMLNFAQSIDNGGKREELRSSGLQIEVTLFTYTKEHTKIYRQRKLRLIMQAPLCWGVIAKSHGRNVSNSV